MGPEALPPGKGALILAGCCEGLNIAISRQNLLIMGPEALPPGKGALILAGYSEGLNIAMLFSLFLGRQVSDDPLE